MGYSSVALLMGYLAGMPQSQLQSVFEEDEVAF
jgi:hypothetical protein